MSKEARIVKVKIDSSGKISGVSDPDAARPVLEGPDLPLKGIHYGWYLKDYLEKGVDMSNCYATDASVASNPRNVVDHLNTAGLAQLELIKLDCGYWGAYKRRREYGVEPIGDTGMESLAVAASTLSPTAGAIAEAVLTGKAMVGGLWSYGFKGVQKADEAKLGPQRDFGLIIGKHVWLAQFIGGSPNSADIKAANQASLDEFKKLKLRCGEVLVESMAARGCGIKLLEHAAATYIPPKKMLGSEAPYNEKSMYVILPDIHLPERWPDMPAENERYNGFFSTQARAALRTDLLNCQRPPALKYQNTMGEARQIEIQKYINKIQQETGFGTSGGQQPSIDAFHDIEDITTDIYHLKNASFTWKQFLCEKAVVDRVLRAESTWFYGRGPDWATDPPADPTFFGDATPAVDLINFLRGIIKTRDTLAADDVKHFLEMVQLGDLYEMWVNHEFLYRHFPENKDEPAKAPAAYTIISGLAISAGHTFQHRRDRDWLPSKKFNYSGQDVKIYVFDRLSKTPMIQRHITGGDFNESLRKGDQKKFETARDSITDSVYNAVNTELGRREWNVDHFSLCPPINYGQYPVWKLSKATGNKSSEFAAKFHISAHDKHAEYGFSEAFMNLLEHDSTWANTADFRNKYYVTNRVGHTEIYWNKVILDLLLDALEAKVIYGNHDGYRGDPLVNNSLSTRAKVQTPWLSFPGIWCEHSHRWDPYNRDGMAFGAGVTNLTYYKFFMLTQHRKVTGLQGLAAPEEQVSFIPGAALWFMLKHFGSNDDWSQWIRKMDAVKGFGIYVSGHTHAGSVARLKFEPSTYAGMQKKVADTKNALGDAIDSNIKEPIRQLGNKVEDFKQGMLPSGL